MEGCNLPEELQNVECFKFLPENLVCKGFQYKLGLNIDHVPFTTCGSCIPGGLYFTTLEFRYRFMSYGPKMGKVTFPPGTRFYKDPEGDKWKADRFILSNMVIWSDVLPEAEQLKGLLSNSDIFKYIKQPTLEMKSYMVSEGSSRHRLEKYLELLQSEEGHLALVKYNPLLSMISQPSDKVIELSIKHWPQTISSVQDPKEKWQLMAVKQVPLNIQYIKNPTLAVQQEAVSKGPYSIAYIKNPSAEIQIIAFKKNPCIIPCLKRPCKYILNVLRNNSSDPYLLPRKQTLRSFRLLQRSSSMKDLENLQKDFELFN